ncbi:transposase [Virgibacillus proomii]|uniref:transposase n=1 Tax=Virgibacillus proomii TaxID=84407 RepID=UPI000987293E
MKQVYGALDEERCEETVKRSKKLIWKSLYKLNEDEKEKAVKLLLIDPCLEEAYQLKIS